MDTNNSNAIDDQLLQDKVAGRDYTLGNDQFFSLVDHAALFNRAFGFIPYDSGGIRVYTGIAPWLQIEAGYSWDGPSGPAIPTIDFMFPSLIHDVLYELMSRGVLDKSFRAEADNILFEQCRLAGMSWLRAKYVWAAVRLFGASHVEGKSPSVVVAEVPSVEGAGNGH